MAPIEFQQMTFKEKVLESIINLWMPTPFHLQGIDIYNKNQMLKVNHFPRLNQSHTLVTSGEHYITIYILFFKKNNMRDLFGGGINRCTAVIMLITFQRLDA